jgi:SNF2 family DNA or RNA helicase
MKAYAQKTIDGYMSVQADYYYKELLKKLGGAWDPYNKSWMLPYRKDVWETLQYSIAGIIADQNIMDELDEPYSDTHKEAKEAPVPPLKVNLYKYQQAAYAEAYNAFNNGRRGYAFLAEMGTGKSLMTIATVSQLYLERRINKVLIVAPLAVCPVWDKEFRQFASIQYNLTVLKGSTKDKTAQLKDITGTGLQVVVVNYESAWRIEPDLLKYNADMIVCDESQRIKNPRANQSKTMHVLGDKAKYKLILTGTPVTATPLDFWSQYRFLDSSIFGPSYYAFRTRHAILGGFESRQVIGYRDLKGLCKKAHSIAYRVTKRTALDLPDETEEIYYCEFEPKAAKLYRQIYNDGFAKLEQGVISTPHKITQLLRLSQLCGGYLAKDIDPDSEGERTLEKVSNAKLELFTDIITDLLDNPSKKVVVFARFRAELYAISEILNKLIGADAVRIMNGDTPNKDRGQFVADFQTNPGVRVFLANQQCAGLGITLTASDTVIFYSNSYNYADYEQAKARVHRIGQKNKCTYIHLLVKDSIDEDVLKNLQHKGDTAKLVVDFYK